MKLEEFWTTESKFWESLQARLEGAPADPAAPDQRKPGALEKLQDELKRVQARRQKATARREKAQTDLAAAKAKLAAEGSFGNIPAVTAEARKQQARVQRHDGMIARLSEEIFELEAGVALLNEALAAVTARRLAAAAGLADATARATRRDAWIAKAAAEPLAKLSGWAGAAKEAKMKPPFTDADANVTARLGAELRTILDRRHAIATSHRKRSASGLAQVVELLAAQGGAGTGGSTTGVGAATSPGAKSPREARSPAASVPDAGGVGPESLAAWALAYEEAFAALGDYAQHGQERFDAAIATLTTLAKAPLATDAERKQLDSGPFLDAIRAKPPDVPAAEAKTPLELAASRDAQLSAHLDALAKAEAQAVAALAADPGSAVVAVPPLGPLGVADEAYDPLIREDEATEPPAVELAEITTPKALLEQWQTALPDATYKAVAAFYLASDALDELVATPPLEDGRPTLVQLLAAAEDRLATGRARAAAAERRTAFLQLLLATQRKRAARAGLGHGDLLFALLRGDV